MANNRLTGGVVAFSSGVDDMYYDYPNLDGARFIGAVKGEDMGENRVQLNFELKDGREWSILFIPH